jgi:hypothetical protein
MTLGVNAPIFSDASFEFIPILEFYDDDMYFLRKENHFFTVENGKKQETEPVTFETRTYSTIAARNKQYGNWLSDYIPWEYDCAVVHYDPDFKSFTYGDAVDTPKGMQISKLKKDDYIFFVASLAPYKKEAYIGKDENVIRYYQKGCMAKHVIGHFRVQASYFAHKMLNSEPTPLTLHNTFSNDENGVEAIVNQNTLNRIKNNAHSKRDEDHYSIVVGDPSDSALLTRAIALTQKGFPFKPSDVGKEAFGEACYPRGVKWIYDARRIQRLLDYCHSSI